MVYANYANTHAPHVHPPCNAAHATVHYSVTWISPQAASYACALKDTFRLKVCNNACFVSVIARVATAVMRTTVWVVILQSTESCRFRTSVYA